MVKCVIVRKYFEFYPDVAFSECCFLNCRGEIGDFLSNVDVISGTKFHKCDEKQCFILIIFIKVLSFYVKLVVHFEVSGTSNTTHLENVYTLVKLFDYNRNAQISKEILIISSQLIPKLERPIM